MEIVVEVVGNAEAKIEDTTLAKTSSTRNSLKEIADPVVYQLVRVEGDGRLVPATDDEVMEVEDLLEVDKGEMGFLEDTGRTLECTSNNEFSSDKTHVKGSEGLCQSGNLEVDVGNSNALLGSTICMVKLNSRIEEIVPLSAPSTDDSHIAQSASGECSNPLGGMPESESLTSTIGTSWKPDFSMLKGEICLDNLSVRELHETFKATFGRETSVKDKQWLKRRISMGLTNSCDVSTTTFIIENNAVVKKGKEESSKSVDGKVAKNPVVEAADESRGDSSAGEKKQMENFSNDSGKKLEYNSLSEDPCAEQRAAKRIRKPTRRYIEEVSEGESRENSKKITSPVQNSGHGQSSPRIWPVQNVCSTGRPLVTRQDSLGGSGIQIPYVSRVRRGRPRENFMALMKLQTSEMGMPARLVKKSFGVCDPQPDNERENKVFKARLAAGWVQKSLISEAENAEEYLERKTIELDTDVSLKHMDLSGDSADDNIVTVPTTKGGMRRKHHRPWTLSEVVKLVDGVAKYGAGRWSEIKRIYFASYSYRTSVDLKDKWRNLLRASFAQLPADKGMDNLRKNASAPIPSTILVRVRELAEMHSQFPLNLSGVKFGLGGSGVHERRSGYL